MPDLHVEYSEPLPSVSNELRSDLRPGRFADKVPGFHLCLGSIVSERPLPSEYQVIFVHVRMTVESSSALVLLDQSHPEEGAPRPEERHQKPVGRARLFSRSQRPLGCFEGVIVENVHHRPPPHVPRQRPSLPQIDLVSPERCQTHHKVQRFRSQRRDCDRCLPLRELHQPACPLAHLVPEPVGEREQRFTVSLRHLRLRFEEQFPRQVCAHRPFRYLVVEHDFHVLNTSSQEVFKIAWKQPRSLLGERIPGATPGVTEAGIVGPDNANVFVASGLKRSHTQLASRRPGTSLLAESYSQILEGADVRVLKKLTTTLSVDSEGDSESRTKHPRQSAARFSVRELGSSTWPDFERMVEKHNGVWGGC